MFLYVKLVKIVDFIGFYKFDFVMLKILHL